MRDASASQDHKVHRSSVLLGIFISCCFYTLILTISSINTTKYLDYIQQHGSKLLSGFRFSTNAPIPEQAPFDVYSLGMAKVSGGCSVLDHPFPASAPPDYTLLKLDQWTDCQEITQIAQGWRLEHCRHPNAAKTDECHPGGYFKIQRLSTPTTETTVGSDAPNDTDRCTVQPNYRLSKHKSIHDYVAQYLGPDAFHVSLIGPQKINLMQQQPLGNCAYAIPYMLSRPGIFYLEQVNHLYEDYHALKEIVDLEWSPTYYDTKLLTYRDNDKLVHQFNVCGHCEEQEKEWHARQQYSGWPEEVKLDTIASQEQHLSSPQSQKQQPFQLQQQIQAPICPRSPSQGQRLYGTYKRLLSTEATPQPDDYLWAFEQPYAWEPARPSCRLDPPVELFLQASNISDAERTRARECLQHSRKIYFAGDSHLRMLYSATVQRLQGHPGDVSPVYHDHDPHEQSVDNVTCLHEFDPYLTSILVQIRYLLTSANRTTQIPEEYDYTQLNHTGVTHLDVLRDKDTVVFGMGHWCTARYEHGHWPSQDYFDRIALVFRGLVELRQMRREVFAASTNEEQRQVQPRDLKVIWYGLPAWTNKLQNKETKGGDWRTNTRLSYWNLEVERMMRELNKELPEAQDFFDKINVFDITFPFKYLTTDSIHYTRELPVDAMMAELLHKLDICRPVFSEQE